MNTIPTIFNFDTNSVRAMVIDDQPWFVAVDVCKALEIINVTNAIKRLDDDEQALYSIKGLSQIAGGNEEINIINESGLYSLILGSRKKEAKRFKKWVTSEVLPAIRKTGQYIAQPYAQNPGDKLTKEQADTLRNLLTGAVQKLPKEKQAGAMIQGWAKLKAHFKVGYRQIPQSEFTEAISIISRHVIEGEYIAKNEPEPAVISKALQESINRKAHAVALAQYDTIKDIITDAAQKNLNCGATEEDCQGYVDNYGDAASDVTVINNRDLFMLASKTTALLNTAGEALETIHHLEKHLGRQIYPRKTTHGNHYGLPAGLVESVIEAANGRMAIEICTKSST